MFCKLCNVKFNSKKDETEHSWSLLHHRKLFRAEGRNAEHKCNLCDETSESFALFTKHINSDKHRSLMTKWIRLDASDTAGTNEEENNENQLSKNEKQNNHTQKKGKNKSSERHQRNYNQHQPPGHQGSQFYWINPRFPSYRPPFNHPRGVAARSEFQQDFRHNFNVFQPHVRKRFLNRQPQSFYPVPHFISTPTHQPRPSQIRQEQGPSWNDHVQTLINTKNESKKPNMRQTRGNKNITKEGEGELTEEEDKEKSSSMTSTDNKIAKEKDNDTTVKVQSMPPIENNCKEANLKCFQEKSTSKHVDIEKEGPEQECLKNDFFDKKIEMKRPNKRRFKKVKVKFYGIAPDASTTETELTEEEDKEDNESLSSLSDLKIAKEKEIPTSKETCKETQANSASFQILPISKYIDTDNNYVYRTFDSQTTKPTSNLQHFDQENIYSSTTVNFDIIPGNKQTDREKEKSMRAVNFPIMSPSESIPIIKETCNELDNLNVGQGMETFEYELLAKNSSDDEDIPLSEISRLKKLKNPTEENTTDIPSKLVDSSSIIESLQPQSSNPVLMNKQYHSNSSGSSDLDDLPPAFVSPEQVKPLTAKVREILERSLLDSPLNTKPLDTSLLQTNETDLDFSIEKSSQQNSEAVLSPELDRVPLSSMDDTNELLDRLEREEIEEPKAKTILEPSKDNVKELLKKMKPISVKIRKLRSRGKKEIPTSEEGDNSQDSDTATSNFTSEENAKEVNDQKKMTTCAFKKPDNTVCQTSTYKKFCEYHERVLLAVEAFISQKVASNTDHPKSVSAVSLIEPEDSASDNHPQSPVSCRKRSISSCLSSENESSTHLDMSRFKRSKTNREHSTSTSISSVNPLPSTQQLTNVPTKTTLKGTRFKYLNNLTHAGYPGLTDISLTNLPPTVRKLIEKRARKTRNSQSESEADAINQDVPHVGEQSNTEDDIETDHTHSEHIVSKGYAQETEEVQPPPSSPDSIRALFHLQPTLQSPSHKQQLTVEKVKNGDLDLNLDDNPLLDCLDTSFSKENDKEKQGLASTPGNKSHLPSPDISSITVNSQCQELTTNNVTNHPTERTTDSIDMKLCSDFKTSALVRNEELSMDETFRTAEQSLDETLDNFHSVVEKRNDHEKSIVSSSSIVEQTSTLETENFHSISERVSSSQDISINAQSPFSKVSFQTYRQKGMSLTISEEVHFNKEHTSTAAKSKLLVDDNTIAAKSQSSLSLPRVEDCNSSKKDTSKIQVITSHYVTTVTAKSNDCEKKKNESNVLQGLSLSKGKDVVNSTPPSPVDFIETAGTNLTVEPMDIDEQTEISQPKETTQTIEPSIVLPPLDVGLGKKSLTTQRKDVGQQEKKMLARLDIGNTASIGQRKKKEKVKKKNTDNSIPIKGSSTLSELHIEENRYLQKLARANNNLEDLKSKMTILQATIAKYTNHLQTINEKKKKLISDINVNAQHACDSPQQEITESDFPLPTAAITSLDLSRYSTPPGSPNILADESNCKRNDQVKTTKIFNKLPSRVSCSKVFKNLVFVGCEKPNCAVYVKDLKNSNASTLPRKITASTRPVTCMEVMSYENDNIKLCTGCVGGTVTLYHMNLKTNVWTAGKKFRFGCGGCLSMHYGFDKLFIGFLDGTIHRISRNWQRPDIYDVDKFHRIGKKRRGVTCMSSIDIDGKNILITSTKHGAIYARKMNGDMMKSFRDLQNVCILRIELFNNRIYALNENHTVSIFSYIYPTLRGELLSIIKINPKFAIHPSTVSLCYGSLYVPDVVTSEHLFRVKLEENVFPTKETEIHQCKRRNQIQFLEKSRDKMIMAVSSGDVFTFDVTE